ncbi:MAG TPA: hypothetical protein VMY35_00210 [Phycisphaerae bacterium]|nr:hypothetical protein [Phycisphaerae bacterium]
MTEQTMDKAAMADLAGRAKDAADEAGDCQVVAKVDGVSNNGQTYGKGQQFAMSHHIVPVHAKAGLVSLAKEAKEAKEVEKTKQATTPRDKQVTGGSNK